MKKIYLFAVLILCLTMCTSCRGLKENSIANYNTNNIINTVQREKNNTADIEKDVEPQNIQPVQNQENRKEVETINKEEQKMIVQEEKEKTTNNEVHKDIADKKLIASGETSFNPNQIERSNNIRLAANFINGLILQPGEEFSFNDIVGERTKERGFLPADIFIGQSVAKGYGGGVCQTSSTVCIAVRKTQLKILEQNPHSQRVTYTTIENEAMINYGTSDFRFQNTYNKPILIEITFDNNGDRETIKCDIYCIE